MSVLFAISWTLVAAGAVVFVAAGAWWGANFLNRKRRARLVEYGHQIETFRLAQEGEVLYAQWLHPKETKKTLSQADVDALRRFVREGDLVIDIGAHSGDTTLPLALAAGPSGTTLALEPNPYVFTVLEKNASLNRDRTNIVPLNFAATDEDGTFTFHYSDGGFCNGGFLSQVLDQRHGHRQPLEVEGRDLEKFLRRHYADKLNRFSYIKIDTEGYDRQVIHSLANVLREHQPVIVCEVYKRLTEAERAALFAKLDELGYETFKYEAGGAAQGEKIDRSALLKWLHFDVLALPRAKQIAAAA